MELEINMNWKNKIANWMFENMSFPKGCKSSGEFAWMFKDNCPCCIAHHIEPLSNYEYHKKYPAKNELNIGVVKIYMCDYHLKELKEILNS